MFGKLLGAMIGVGIGLAAQSAVAAFVLALVGLFFGHRLDVLNEAPLDADEALLSSEFDDHEEDEDAAPAPLSRHRADLPPPPRPPPPREETHADLEATRFIPAACGLLVELARVDGEISGEEIRVAREYFEEGLGYGPRSLQLVRNGLKAAMAQEPKVDRWVAACRQHLDPRGRVKLLDGLYQLALVDGALKRSERETLKVIARGLGITDEAHRELTRAYFGDGEEQYALLGVDPEASDDEVKAAFRRLAAEHHPDRFAHQGPDAAEAAAERFRALQDAYDELRRIRNF